MLSPVDELLIDNSTVFHLEVLKEMLDRWKVHHFFSVAYRSSGNEIVERHNRTIKAIAERGHISLLEALFTRQHVASIRSVQSVCVK